MVQRLPLVQVEFITINQTPQAVQILLFFREGRVPMELFQDRMIIDTQIVLIIPVIL